MARSVVSRWRGAAGGEWLWDMTSRQDPIKENAEYAMTLPQRSARS
jgi:hypothetical protein